MQFYLQVYDIIIMMNMEGEVRSVRDRYIE